MEERKRIVSFKDLEVYRNSYYASIVLAKEILPLLPQSEKYDLIDQIARSSKAVPRLIAEGYAKRHQKRGFQKYLDDAMAECNELIVCLEHVVDIYDVETVTCNHLIGLYDQTGRQIYKLSNAWKSFKTETNT